MSLAASNYLIYIEKYFRQRFRIRHEISHLFCRWFKKKLLPTCFTNRLNHLWRGFEWFSKLVLFEANKKKLVLVSNQFKTSMRNKWIVYQTGSKLNLFSAKHIGALRWELSTFAWDFVKCRKYLDIYTLYYIWF